MRTVKIFFSENDVEDMASDIRKGREGLYDTWMPVISETGERINLEIHLGNEE